MANLVGKSLGKYKLTECLGKGGMAEVYKAYHPTLDRYVTIKILHSYLAEGEDFLARFKREARAVASLRHAHIVQIHDFDVDDECYYMVMEFIDGNTLQARVNELSKTGRYMPAGEVLSILRQVAEALDYAHKQGVLHRDIKPSNIMVNTNGNAFLTDFGIARMMGVTQFTTTGSLIGTPTYMSPEQGKGLELDAASDIYSLGVILYELLTGKVPYTADTPLAVIHQHVNNPLPAPHLLRPDLPPAVEQVITKALEKEPGQRYQTAMALCQDLKKAMTREVIDQLDATGTRSAPPLAAMPTMRMEEPVGSERGQAKTEMMGDGTRAELEAAAVSQKPAVKKKEPAGVHKTTKKEKPAPAAVEKPVPGEKPSLLAKLKSRPWLIVMLGVVLVAILILIISLAGGSSSCSNVSNCIALKEQLLQQGDTAGALDALTRAINHVAPQDHQVWAYLWCDRALLLEQLGRIDEANGSRASCEAWGRGE